MHPRDDIWNTSVRERTDDEWRSLLEDLTRGLAAVVGVRLSMGELRCYGSATTASSSAHADLTGVVHAALGLQLRGSLNVTINHSESVGISADLLLFVGEAHLCEEAPCGSFFGYVLDEESKLWRELGFIPDVHGEYSTRT